MAKSNRTDFLPSVSRPTFYRHTWTTFSELHINYVKVLANRIIILENEKLYYCIHRHRFYSCSPLDTRPIYWPSLRRLYSIYLIKMWFCLHYYIYIRANGQTIAFYANCLVAWSDFFIVKVASKSMRNGLRTSNKWLRNCFASVWYDFNSGNKFFNNVNDITCLGTIVNRPS